MKTGTYINSAKITSVNIGSVVQAQPKYGVVPVHIQPKYGVAVPPTGSTGTIYPPKMPGAGGVSIQPAYGVQIVHLDLDITYDQLEKIIQDLRQSISKIKSSWDGETKRNVSILNNSWVGDDCAVYTSKLTSMDGKVHNTIEALELLCSTYEQARDMVKENQSKTLASVESIK